MTNKNIKTNPDKSGSLHSRLSWRRNLIRLSLFILTFNFITFNSFAQGNMISISSTVPSDVTVCGTAKSFTVNINNPSPFLLTDVTLTVSMPVGMRYQQASITGATELDVSKPDRPVFSLTNIDTLTNRTITFTASADCDIMSYLADGNLANNTVRVDYTANNTIKTYDAHTSFTYLVKQPNLSITAVTNQTYTGNIGDTYTRCITITNGGVGELSRFEFTDIHGSGIKITKTDVGTWTNSGTTESVILSGTDFTKIGNGNNLFESGEKITICETVNVTNCTDVASLFNTYWGCNNQTCQSSSSSANVVFPNLTPNLAVTAVPLQGTCYGSTVAQQQQLKIINTGKGQATDVQLDIYMSEAARYSTYNFSSIDPNSFTVQVNSASPQSISLDSTKANTAHSCLPASPKARAYLTIPTINGGDTVYLKWNFYNCCASCGGDRYKDVNGWMYQGSYKSICQNSYIIPLTQGRYFSRIDAELTNNSSPASLVSGQTGTFNFMFSTYDNWYVSANSKYWKFVYTIPKCLSYAGNLKVVRYDNTGVWSPTSVSTSGNKVTAIFNGNPPWSLAQAQLLIDLSANCSSCAGGQDTAVAVQSFFVPDNTCSCEIGLACTNTSIRIICPVTCDGMNNSSFEIKRTSYGFPDNNNDGTADGSGTLDFNKIRTDRVMMGDTITAAFTGRIRTSVSNPSWLYGYASNTITNGTYLNFLDAELKIYRGGNVYTCSIDTNAVTNNGTTRTFSFDFSSTVLVAKGCVSAGFVYSSNDSVVFKPRYRVATNPWRSVIVQCYVTNEFYVSKTASPTAFSDKYSCNSFKGNFNLLSGDYESWSPDAYTVSSCNTVTLSQNYYSRQGFCCNNHAGVNYFPYEYRQWTHLDTLAVKIPEGYEFISAQLRETRGTVTYSTSTSSWFTITPVNAKTDSLIFPLRTLYEGSGGTIPLGDDGFYGTVEITLAPSCAVVPNQAILVKYYWFYSNANFASGSGTIPYYQANDDYLTYKGPSLFLQSSLPTVMAFDKTVSWDISLSNTTSIDAANTWIAGPKISGVSITEVFNKDKGTVITPAGEIYRLDTLKANGVKNYRITAAYTSCQQDSIVIHAGWNCNAGYPASVASYPCSTKQLKLKLVPQIPTLIANITSPPVTLSLCDTAEYLVEGVNIQIGTGYNVKLNVTLPLGVSIIVGTSQLSYPVVSSYVSVSDPKLLSGTTYEYNISALNTLIGKNGLKGMLNTDSNSVKIKFKVRTDCNYTSGSMIGFVFNGQSACGITTGQEVALSSQLAITGASEPYFTEVKLISSYISPCANNSTMKVVVRNNGPASFGNNDSVQIQLPEDVSYVSASFRGIYNVSQNTEPVQSVFNNQILLQWKITPNIVAGDSMVFSFDFKGNKQKLSCGINEFKAKTISPKYLLCTLTGNQCNVNVITGDTTLPMYIYQAFLSLQNTKASATPNPPDGESIVLDLNITNNGETILDGNYSVIAYYYDVDGDSTFSQGDILLGKDTLTSEIKNNSTIKHTANLIIPAGKACAVIAAIDTSLNTCVCSSDPVIIPIPLNSSMDATICADQSVTLTIGYSPVNGYTYTWQPSQYLDDSTLSNPQFTFTDYTQDITVTYVVTTSRIACTTQDTVNVFVTQPPSVYLGEDDTIACNKTITLDAGNIYNTYLWQDNSTQSTFTVKNKGTYYVKAQYGECYVYDTVAIYLKCPNTTIWVPNVFTPNSDGVNDLFPNGDKINDTFYAVGENITCYKLLIFNRWGELLFKTEEFSESWDGTYKGKLVPDGVYIWTINYCGLEDGKETEKELIGHVTVLK